MIKYNKKPLLSIITVVLNRVQTIEATIKTVIDQQDADYEYIIIDGGSTDGTLDIINKYIDKISYFVSEKDSGIYDAMNKGILASRGEVLYFLGSDDTLIDSKCISDIMSVYTKDEPDMLYGNVLYKQKGVGDVRKLGRKIYLFDIKAGRRPSHQATFMKRSKVIEAGMFNFNHYKVAADFDLMCYFFIHQLKIKYVNRNVSIFGTNGVSSNFKNIVNKESAEIIKKNFGIIRMIVFLLKKKARLVLKI
jgi:glycosyltransferase involved in cell wall biosynthesis